MSKIPAGTAGAWEPESHSAVLFRNGAFTILKSPFAETTGILPSLIYIRKDFERFFGRSAALTYLRDDTGRQAIWETYHAGVLDYWIDMGTDTELDPILIQDDICLQIDTGAKGRLLQSVKTGLRSAHYTGTSIFGWFYTIQDLIALLLSELHSAAESSLEQPVDGVLLGRPVKFSDNETVDRRAQAILLNAAKDAGFKQIDFMLEPVAAAYSYHDASASMILSWQFPPGWQWRRPDPFDPRF